MERSRTPISLRAGLAGCCLVLLFFAFSLTPGGVLFGPSPALAQGIRLEGEANAREHNLGGGPLVEKPCEAASSGYALKGLDVDGEWIEWDVEIEVSMAAELAVQSAADWGLSCVITVAIRDSLGAERVAETFTTIPGRGTQ